MFCKSKTEDKYQKREDEKRKDKCSPTQVRVFIWNVTPWIKWNHLLWASPRRRERVAGKCLPSFVWRRATWRFSLCVLQTRPAAAAPRLIILISQVFAGDCRHDSFYMRGIVVPFCLIWALFYVLSYCFIIFLSFSCTGLFYCPD